MASETGVAQTFSVLIYQYGWQANAESGVVSLQKFIVKYSSLVLKYLTVKESTVIELIGLNLRG